MATIKKSKDLITYDITTDSFGTCGLIDTDAEWFTRLHRDIIFCEVFVKDESPGYIITLYLSKFVPVAERKKAVQKVLEFLKNCGAIEGTVADIMKTVKSW